MITGVTEMPIGVTILPGSDYRSIFDGARILRLFSPIFPGRTHGSLSSPGYEECSKGNKKVDPCF